MMIIDNLQYANWSEKIFNQMREGNVDAVHVTISYHETFRETVLNFEKWNLWFENYSQLIIKGSTAADIDLAKKTNRTAIFFGFQNPSPIEDDIGLIEILHTLGARFMQLTYNNQSLLATGCYEDNDAGITRMGKQVIKEMNRVGIIVDMSHSAEKSTIDAINISQKPIAITHANPAFWHSAKRRDADGDADSVMLLLDALLNFSRQFLSDKIGGLMDAPLLIQPIVLPHEAQTQAHNFEVTKKFPLAFYESTSNHEKSGDIRNIETLAMRKDTGDENMFHDYFFTHGTTTLTSSKSRSAYSTLESMVDKLDLQIKNADIINAVETKEIVSYLIQTHLIPDIMGNIRAYAKQKFRCTACGAKYRRMPLLQKCTCGHKLLQTITRPSIEKYLPLAKKLVTKYDVDPYLKGRIMTLSDEIELLFGKGDGSQQLLTDFVN